MASNIIRVDYEILDDAVQRFKQLTEKHQQLVKRVSDCSNTLSAGGWKGVAAQQFQEEMDSKLLPKLQRLCDAFDSAREITLNVKQIMSDAEEEAARLFEGEAEEDGIAPIVIGAFVIGGIVIAGAIGSYVLYQKNVFETHPAPGKNVVGNTESLKQYWERQSALNCGYYATRNILKAFGKDVSIANLQTQAGEEVGDEGTDYEDYKTMFETNGTAVDSYLRFDSREAGLKSMENDIKNNKAVLARISVDPLTLWGNTEGGHAVWVTGLRYDDDGNVTHVICNDSGIGANGAGIEYSASEFLDAWQERGYSYIASKDPMTDI